MTLAPALVVLGGFLDRADRDPRQAQTLFDGARELFAAARATNLKLSAGFISAMDMFGWASL